MNRIELNTINNDVFYHFTNRDNYESIDKYGLIPNIGDNANGIEKTKKVFFSKGNIGLLRICDVWINWYIYRISLYDNVLKYKNISEDEKWKLKKEFRNNFTNGLYYNEDYIKIAYEAFMQFMNSNIILKLDLDKNDYDENDIDEAKDREIPDFMNRMYLGYYTSSDKVETFNMHTKSGIGIDIDKISKIESDNNDKALYILKNIYEKEKDKDENLRFTFLDSFINYVDSIDSNMKL